MAKYSPLKEQLQRRSTGPIEFAFTDIADWVVGLPVSAHRYRAWWANDRSHVQARAWLDAGWDVDEVCLQAGRVRFRRRETTAE